MRKEQLLLRYCMLTWMEQLTQCYSNDCFLRSPKEEPIHLILMWKIDVSFGFIL